MAEKKAEQNAEKNVREHKKPTLLVALIPILVLIALLFYGIKVQGQDAHIYIVMGGLVACGVAAYLGFSWQEMENAFLGTLQLAMQANIILCIVGMLMGTWILSGTIQTMIYYGLLIINPNIFLFVCCLVCSVVSLATGSSWSTAGTIGVAMVGIGIGLNVPPAMTAGAVISGAYFGDKMSPLSDTTNLAPAVAGSTLFDHIKHMVYTTGPSYVLASILFLVFGFRYAGQNLDPAQINDILTNLSANFTISPVMLIAPALVIAMVIFKIPAMPGLIAGVLLGGVLFLLFQGQNYDGINDGMGQIFNVMQWGFTSETGHEVIDNLLSRGGFQNMLWSVSIVFCSMFFGGVMEKTGCLEVVTGALLSRAKRVGSLVAITIFSSFFINLVASDQYLAIVIPGRMYNSEYRRRGLAPKNLSRCLEDAGTLTSPLVPWNACGAYMANTLGVPTLEYLPYCFLNLINPFVSIILGFTGITMEKLSEEEKEKARLEFGDRVAF